MFLNIFYIIVKRAGPSAARVGMPRRRSLPYPPPTAPPSPSSSPHLNLLSSRLIASKAPLITSLKIIVCPFYISLRLDEQLLKLNDTNPIKDDLIRIHDNLISFNNIIVNKRAKNAGWLNATELKQGDDPNVLNDDITQIKLSNFKHKYHREDKNTEFMVINNASLIS